MVCWPAPSPHRFLPSSADGDDCNADDNADDDADADTDLVCPQCGGAHCQTLKPITADHERLCDCCHAHTALFTPTRGKEPES